MKYTTQMSIVPIARLSAKSCATAKPFCGSLSSTPGESAAGTATSGEIANRVGQPQERNARNQQRRHAAHDEHGLPSEAGDERRRDEASYRRTERKPADHRRDRGPPPAPWHVLGGERDGVRHRSSHAEASQRSKRRKPLDRLSGRRQERADAENQHAPNEYGTSSELVGQRTADHRADHHPDQATGDNRAEHVAWNLHRRAQRRRDVSHRLRIEPVDEDDERAHEAHEQLVAADRALINEPADVEDGCVLHRSALLYRSAVPHV
jgi:hypothetical protein